MNNRLLIAAVLAFIVLAGALYVVIRLLTPAPLSSESVPLSLLLAGQEKRVVPTVIILVRSGDRESDLSRSLMSRLEEIYRGRAVFRCIDVDNEPEIARAYHYRILPLTVIMDPGGKVLYLHEGYADEDVIVEKLKSAGIN